MGLDARANLHLPRRDPYGEAVRRQLYIWTLGFGLTVLLLGILLRRTLNLHEPYLQYVAPALLVLGAVKLWWLLSGRALIVAEIAGVAVMAAASVIQVVLVSLASSSVAGAYPNSGPYWSVISVCVLAFVALPARRALTFNLIFLFSTLFLPWLLPVTYAAPSVSGLARVQFNTVLVFMLVWGLSWFRGQYVIQTQTQEVLRQMAFTDPLTYLPNRHAVYPAVDALLRNAARGRPGSLFLIDIDHFKRINDYYGHGVGDEVLIAVGQVLRNHDIEEGAPLPTVGRWGGEEFIVVLPETTAQGAQVRAGQLLAEFRDWAWPQDIQITVSIGSSSVRVGEDFSSLLARADAALYQAKALGRNQAVVHDQPLSPSAAAPADPEAVPE